MTYRVARIAFYPPGIDYLKQTAAALGRSVKLHLLLLAIRWVIAFGAIGILTRSHANLEWLWQAGAAGVVVSVIVTLAIHFFVPQQATRARVRPARHSAPLHLPLDALHRRRA
jgi:hypothetical protein